MDFIDACQAIQAGYLEGLERPEPFVLAENHGWLRDIVMTRLIDNKPSDKSAKNKGDKDDEFEKFRKKYTTLKDIKGVVPDAAEAALKESFPKPLPEYEVKHRDAGLGSLGRQRFTGVAADWQGGIIVREAKALVPSAWLWANQSADKSYTEALSAKRIYYAEILGGSVRSADPSLVVVDRWAARRLGPDAFKIEIQDIKTNAIKELATRLLKAMGKEIANVHAPPAASSRAIVEHLGAISNNGKSAKWLSDAALTMVKETEEDFQEWKRQVPG